MTCEEMRGLVNGIMNRTKAELSAMVKHLDGCSACKAHADMMAAKAAATRSPQRIAYLTALGVAKAIELVEQQTYDKELP